MVMIINMDELLKKLYKYQKSLISDDPSFLDVIDYSLVTAMIAYLLLKNEKSQLTIFAMRMVIEHLSIKRLSQHVSIQVKNDISLEVDELIKTIQQIDENLPYFRLDYLKEKDLTYHQIVNKYLSHDLTDKYLCLSLVIHPHFNSQLLITDCLEKENVIDKLIYDEFSLLSKVEDLPYQENNVFNQEIQLLKNVQSNDSYYLETRDIIVNLLKSAEKLLSYNQGEFILISFKTLLELIAFFAYLKKEDKLTNNLARELVKEHTFIKYKYFQHEKFNIDEAYELYNEICIKGLKKEKFQEVFLKNYFGLNILENDKPQTYFTLVNNYLDKYFNDNKEEILSYYLISQALSHGNGYLYFYKFNNLERIIFIIKKLINNFLFLLN